MATRLSVILSPAAFLVDHTQRNHTLHWTKAATAVAVFAALLLATIPVLSGLLSDWSEIEGFSHAPLVVLVSLYICYARWRDGFEFSPEWRAIPLLFATACVLAIGRLMGIQILEYAILPVIILATIVYLSGWRGSLRFVAPISYLYFALPVWLLVTPLLLAMTVAVTERLVQWWGITANVEANLVHIPSGTFEIAAGCAGTNFALTAMAIAGFAVMLGNASTRENVVLVSLALALAILGNWVRVFSLIAIGYQTEMRHSLIVDGHATYGWMIFIIAMVPVFIVSRRSGFAPVRRSDEDESPARRPLPGTSVLASTAAAVLAIILPVTFAFELNRAAAASHSEFVVSWPEEHGSWIVERAEWEPTFVGADFMEVRRYSSGVMTANVYLAGYSYQEQGKEPDNFENLKFAGDAVVVDSRIVGQDSRRFQVYDLFAPSSGSSKAYFAYFVADKALVSQVRFKLAALVNKIKGKHASSAFGAWVTCQSACSIDDADVLELLQTVQWSVR